MTDKKIHFLENLQALGKSLMLPVAVMPIAAILLRIGQPDLLNIPAISAAGSAIFENLPILFSIGVAMGMSYNDANNSAPLAGVVGYFVITSVAKTLYPEINMGVLAGIFGGLLGAWSYNKFYNIELPAFLGFFSGRRFVPIITGLLGVFVGFLCGLTWQYVGTGINTVGNAITSSGAIGLFIFGLLNRLLIPFGLHHILNNIVWFIFGSYTTSNGTIVHGDLTRFFEGDPTAGLFMTGFYPIMMFGLLGAALAFYLTSNIHKRKQLSGLFLSLGLTSFLTGITEPLEFAFMFSAPLLYFIHAVLTGTSMALVNEFGIHHGFGFSAGLIDYLLNWNLATKPLLIIPIGLVYFTLYFVIFFILIRFMNLKTPGREESDMQNNFTHSDLDDNTLLQLVMNAIGDKNNIETSGYCITRLRLTLKDPQKIDQKALELLAKYGYKSIIIGNNGIQIIMGSKAEHISNKL